MASALLVVGGVIAAGCSSNGNGREDVAEDLVVRDDTGDEFTDDGRDGTDDVGPDIEPEADAEVDVPTDADGDHRDGTEDAVPDVEDGGDEFDADSLLPRGCRFVFPTTDIGYGWAGHHSIDAGKFVWRWADVSVRPSETVLMVRDLATGADHEVLRRRYPDMLDVPAIHGDSVFFMSQLDASPTGYAEIFRVSVLGGPEERVTNNTISDSFPVAGDDYVVYRSDDPSSDAGSMGQFRYFDIRAGTEHTISDRSPAAPITFDGHRWVAFMRDDYILKFDLLDAGAGARYLATYEVFPAGLAFDRETGIVVVGAFVVGESDDYRLMTWDMATNATTVLLDDPWSQVLPDVDGRLVAYQDSQAAGESYWAHQLSELRVVDRDTGVKRVVMPLDTYYGVGIWERWIAFNNYGTYGDSLIICDLVEGGYLDADLHVIPE